MAENSVYERIVSLLSELSGETELQADTRLKEDLALDSIELVQLVLRLNQAFGLKIHSRDLTAEHFGSLAQVTAFVTGRLAG